MRDDDTVDTAEIASRLDVSYATVYRWTQMVDFPPPRIIIGRARAWSWKKDVWPWYEQWKMEHANDRRVK